MNSHNGKVSCLVVEEAVVEGHNHAVACYSEVRNLENRLTFAAPFC